MPADMHRPAPTIAEPGQFMAEPQGAAPAAVLSETASTGRPGEPNAAEVPDGETAAETRAESTAGVRGARLPWRVPVVIGALLLGVGAAVAASPGWIANFTSDSNALNIVQNWGYQSSQGAAPMIALGLGVLATVFFLYVQHHRTRQAGLRRLFAIASAAVLAMGVFAQFAVLTFQPVSHEFVDSAGGTTQTYFQTPWYAMALTTMAFGPLLVGLLMLAALLVSGNYSPIRASLVGLLAMLAGAFAQCAQYIFPLVPSSTQDYGNGGQYTPGWMYWLPGLTPALVAAGAAVIAAAAIWPAITTAIRAPHAMPRLDHLDDAEFDALEEGVHHGETQF